MSGRREKALRRASGLDSAALRGRREFEQRVRQVRARQVANTEITSLAPKRRALAYACLALFGLAILSSILGSC